MHWIDNTDSSNNECQLELRIEGRAGVKRAEMLPDRRHAITADDDGTVRLWDLTRARELCCLGSKYTLEEVYVV